MSKYVCQLPQEIQDEIVTECKKVFESLAYTVNIEEEIENVLNSKLSDISDTIDISKYL
jgi:hypothetical protein